MIGSRRRGVFLYVALGLGLLLVIFVFCFQTFVMNETQMSKHILGNEVAYHLAQAGIGAGVAWFENTKDKCPLAEKLVLLAPGQVNGLSVELPVDNHAWLGELLDSYKNDAHLAVELRLIGFRPVYATGSSPSGIRYDLVEKIGVLQVRAKAVFRESSRTLIMHKQVRVVCNLPYTVSKFTLFTRRLYSLGGETSRVNHLNALRLRRLGLDASEREPGIVSSGIITLWNGGAPDVEDRGWVYIGGDNERFLNLAFGRKGLGEEHHLLDSAYEIASAPGGPNAGYTVKFMQKGFFAGIKDDNDVFDFYPFDAPSNDPVTDCAGLLRLFGSGTSPSATIALGRLFRRYLVFRYIRKVDTNQHAPLPWAPSGKWNPPPLPWAASPAFEIKEAAFDGSYHRYAACMSGVCREPYNRGVDFIQGDYSGMIPPRTLLHPSRVQHRQGIEDFLYRPYKNNGMVRIFTDTGGLVFDGNLERISPGEFFLEKRATYCLPASDFSKFIASSPGRVPGIIYFKGGPITVSRALDLVDGGMICADGTITIKAGISVGAHGRPLCLVSLSGDVVVSTGQTVTASLVALNGTIRKPGGLDITINGNLVLGYLDPETLLRSGGDVELRYDDRLDITRASTSAYSVNLSPERAYFQDN